MTIEDYNEIEEVLAEANAYGLKKEVEQLEVSASVVQA